MDAPKKPPEVETEETAILAEAQRREIARRMAKASLRRSPATPTETSKAQQAPTDDL